MSEKVEVAVQDGSARFSRFLAMRKLMSLQMAEGSPVHEHVIYTSNLMYGYNKLGGSIDDKVKTDIVLNSLPKSYEHFVLFVLMSKREYELNELLNELINYDRIMGMMTPQVSSTSSKAPSFPSKCGEKEKEKESKLGGPTGGIKKPKGKCYKCKKSGHYKADCPMKKQ